MLRGYWYTNKNEALIPDTVSLYIDSITGYSAYLRWNKSLSSNFKSYIISYSTMIIEINSTMYYDTQHVHINNINDTVIKLDNLEPSSQYTFEVEVLNFQNLKSKGTKQIDSTLNMVVETPLNLVSQRI